jgi:hypothetical protein
MCAHPLIDLFSQMCFRKSLPPSATANSCGRVLMSDLGLPELVCSTVAILFLFSNNYSNID